MFLNTDILFTTTADISGREITDYLGILIKREVISADIDNQEMLYAMDARYASLAAAMNARAADIGADAVVGVDFKMDVLNDKLVFTMTGNAVRLNAAEKQCPAAEAVAEAVPAPAEKPAEEVPEEKPAEAAVEAAPAEKPAEQPEQKPEEKPAEVPAEQSEVQEAPKQKVKVRKRYLPWKCHSCNTENDWQFQYCPKCGEVRHFAWTCSSCGQDNPTEYKFCPGCGKVRSRDEEHIITYTEAEYKSMDKQTLYYKLESLGSAAEIYEYMRNLYGNETDSTIHAFLEVLRNNARLEKKYGNGKAGTIDQVKAFFDYGQRVFQIDYSGDTIVCPSCGHSQAANRRNCMRCNVMLIKK